MIRRSLSQAFRSRNVICGNSNACRVGDTSFSRGGHLLSLKQCYGTRHGYGYGCGHSHGSEPRVPHSTSRVFHSSILSQDGESHLRPHGLERDHRRNNRHDNSRHRRGGRAGANVNDRGDGDSLSHSYLFHLENRAKLHDQNFPIIPSSNNGNPDEELLSKWHRTTVEIIMLMSKLWGKSNRQDHHNGSSDKIRLCQFVSLANDLLVKVMMIRKNEIDAIMEDVEYDGTSPNDPGKKNYQQLGGIERQSTEVLCQTVALGWSRCDPTIAADAARKNQAILDMLEDICSKREKIDSLLQGDGKKYAVSFGVRDVMSANTKLYNHVLSSWSRSLDPDAEQHLKGLLDRMAQESRSTLFPKPDTISYNNLLHLHANRGNVSAAEALLMQMEESIHGVTADVYSYSIVMNAFQRRFTLGGPHERSRKDPERAEELLSQLVAKYEQSGFQSAKLRPTNVTFGTVISMYAQADRIVKDDDRNNNATRNWKTKNKAANTNDRESVGWGATNAERVLDWIIGLNERERKSKNIASIGVGEDGSGTHKGFQRGNELIRPSARHFMSVMDAWAKAGKGVEGAQRSERLLNHLVSLYNKLGYVELRPDPLIFGTVIDAWAKADDKHESAEHAELLLHRMEDLFLNRNNRNKREMMSNIAYNLVIDAWSRRSGKDTAERAESILRRLESNYQLTNNSLLRPDVISYTGVMKSYVNHPGGGKKALEILEEMKNQHRCGNSKARPDNKCISVAMDACAKSGLTSEAERLLNGMDDSKKNRLMFNTIITGYTREGRGNEAGAVLRRMIGLSENGGWERCSPDLISYTLCIRAWGNSKSQERVPRARELLDECIRRYQNGDSKCEPSNVIFNDFADIISNSSDDADGETDVLTLFETMERIGCEPNLISFNILIKTCSKANGSDERKRNALQIAASAFNSLSSVGLKADSVTYTAMMHVLLNLMDNSTEKMSAIGGIFRQCCDDGYLNQRILDILVAATSEDDLKSIAAVHSVERPSTLSCLPASWSHNSTRDNATSAE